MQAWENQLNHIPHAKDLKPRLIKCREEDKYEFWAYIGDTHILVAAICFQHVNDIAVLKGKRNRQIQKTCYNRPRTVRQDDTRTQKIKEN